jgi:hypothetical protein
VVRVVAVGALEGRQFTAQAVALVVGRDADELIDEHLLAGPERPDGLLEEAGFVALADPRATTDGEGEGRWVSRYRFVSELHWRTLRRYGLPGRERHDGSLDNCNAYSTGRRNLAPGGEHVAQAVDGDAEVELPRLPRSLANEASGHRGRAAPSGRAGDHRRQMRASSFSPAVPLACHKQQARAVSSGKSRSLRGARWAGRTSLTWGGGGGRNCMACKGSRPCQVG